MKEYKAYSGLDQLPKGKAKDILTPGTLVLEGGALRGLYTAGVIDCLMEHDLNFEKTIGVSAGALNGICYACYQIGRAAHMNLKFRHDPSYVGTKALLKEHSVFGFHYMFYGKPALEWPLDTERLSKSQRKFYCEVTNVKTGKPELKEFHDYPLETFLSYVRASSSLPFFSQPVKAEGTYYMDGGCSLRLPYEAPLSWGEKKVVLVRTRDKDFRKEPVSHREARLYKVKYRRHQAFLHSLLLNPENYNASIDQSEELAKEGKIFILYPSEPINMGRTEGDMEKLGYFYHLGYQDTKKRLPELLSYLKA